MTFILSCLMQQILVLLKIEKELSLLVLEKT